MRAIAVIGIAAIAGGIFLSLSAPPAWSQSPNERTRCLSIADVDSRVDCLENLRGRAQTAPSPMQRISPQEDRELDCRNPQDAPLCREYERQQGIRSGGPQLPTDAYRPPPAQAPAQYGMPSPSFNCARATTVIEQAICSDATLAQWDARMGQLYREALSIQNNSPTLIGDQSRWRAMRNSNCSRTNLSETKSCVLAMTKARVGGLAAVVAANGGNPSSSPPTAAPVPNPWPAPAAPARTVTTNPLSLPRAPDAAAIAAATKKKADEDAAHAATKAGDAALQRALAAGETADRAWDQAALAAGQAAADAELAAGQTAGQAKQARDQVENQVRTRAMVQKAANSAATTFPFTPSPPATPVASSAAINETTEIAFISAIDEARREYNDGSNDLIKGAARVHRRERLCQLLRSAVVRGWTGTVTELSSSSSGKGVLVVSIGPQITVATTNNDFSDSIDHTLLDPSSNVFKQAVSLSKGQRVSFSGFFLPSKTDCVEERSLTQDGSMTDPEFNFRFSDVQAAQ
jgi:uncharacterized protein